MLASTAQDRSSRGRKCLWRAVDGVVDHEITRADHGRVTMEFLRKIEAVKAGKAFVPDPAKDSYLSKHYAEAEFDFASTAQRGEYMKSLRCTQLRRQSFYFLSYVKRENAHIAALIEQYSAEKDPDQLMCIQELIKRKKTNLLYAESIRESISEIICVGEDGAEHLAKCLDILRCI